MRLPLLFPISPPSLILTVMDELPYDTEEPIAALATAWAESALAVVRTAGRGCIDLVASLFSRPEELKRAENGRMIFGSILDPQTGEAVDRVILGVFRPPHGYTGQESVEISCHGSLPGIRRILDALKQKGFRDAAAGEFTLRAFLNGKMDLTRAEAVAEIVRAKTKRAQRLSLGRLSGNIWRQIDGVKLGLSRLLSRIELQLDYGEDEIEEPVEIDRKELGAFRGRLTELSSGYSTGRLYQEGVTAAITGLTNAGKSSLFNLFLKEDRSIVSEVHGTTRDYIESWISLRGIPVRLVDTAGLRESEHPVEREGMRRSESLVESASLVLYLMDAAEGPTEEQRRFAEERAGDTRYIFILNKADLLDDFDHGGEKKKAGPLAGFLKMSALTGLGFSQLEETMEARLLDCAAGSPGAEEGGLYIDSRRQYDLLLRAEQALAAVERGLDEEVPLDFIAADLKEAVDSLGEITGEVSSRDILRQIFSDFCVGK